MQRRGQPQCSATSRAFRGTCSGSTHWATRVCSPPRLLGHLLARRLLLRGLLRLLLGGLRRRRAAHLVELSNQPLGSLGAVALLEPLLQQLHGQHVVFGRRRGDPSATTEAVSGRRRVGQCQRRLVRFGELAGDAERLTVGAQVGEGLVLDGEVLVGGPRALQVSAGEAQPELAQGIAATVGGGLLSGHRGGDHAPSEAGREGRFELPLDVEEAGSDEAVLRPGEPIGHAASRREHEVAVQQVLGARGRREVAGEVVAVGIDEGDRPLVAQPADGDRVLAPRDGERRLVEQVLGGDAEIDEVVLLTRRERVGQRHAAAGAIADHRPPRQEPRRVVPVGFGSVGVPHETEGTMKDLVQRTVLLRAFAVGVADRDDSAVEGYSLAIDREGRHPRVGEGVALDGHAASVGGGHVHRRAVDGGGDDDVFHRAVGGQDANEAVMVAHPGPGRGPGEGQGQRVDGGLFHDVDHRLPVDAVGAGLHVVQVPPMPSAGLLVVGEVAHDGGERREHLLGVGHGDVVVSAAVHDVDALVREVADEIEGLAGGTGTADGAGGMGRPRVLLEGDPARARTDDAEALGEVHADVPASVPSHRVPREVNAGRVDAETDPRELQRLERIEPPPLLPIESKRTPVGRRHEVGPVFRRIGLRLADRLHAGAVQRQHQARVGDARIAGRQHAHVLRGSVDGGAAGDAVGDPLAARRQLEGSLVVPVEGGTAQAKGHLHRLLLFDPGRLGDEVEGDLADRVGSQGRVARFGAFEVLVLHDLGEQTQRRLVLEHHDRHPQRQGLLLTHHQIGDRRIEEVELHLAGRRPELHLGRVAPPQRADDDERARAAGLEGHADGSAVVEIAGLPGGVVDDEALNGVAAREDVVALGDRDLGYGVDRIGEGIDELALGPGSDLLPQQAQVAIARQRHGAVVDGGGDRIEALVDARDPPAPDDERLGGPGRDRRRLRAPHTGRRGAPSPTRHARRRRDGLVRTGRRQQTQRQAQRREEGDRTGVRHDPIMTRTDGSTKPHRPEVAVLRWRQGPMPLLNFPAGLRAAAEVWTGRRRRAGAASHEAEPCRWSGFRHWDRDGASSDCRRRRERRSCGRWSTWRPRATTA